jgi:hypothetical protein
VGAPDYMRSAVRRVGCRLVISILSPGRHSAAPRAAARPPSAARVVEHQHQFRSARNRASAIRRRSLRKDRCAEHPRQPGPELFGDATVPQAPGTVRRPENHQPAAGPPRSRAASFPRHPAHERHQPVSARAPGAPLDRVSPDGRRARSARREALAPRQSSRRVRAIEAIACARIERCRSRNSRPGSIPS